MRERDYSNSAQVEPSAFRWNVRQVSDWLGGTEYMIEILGMDGCVSFGNSIREAKAGLKEALYLWIEHHGDYAIPDIKEGAQIIVLEEPMVVEEFEFINQELKTLNGKMTQFLS